MNQRYEIVRLIAEGGMGAVYEGRDLKLGGSPIAIKRCLLAGESMQRAFVREAELLANLSHPGVAKVRDLFAEPDGHYLIMEYIPGCDMEQIINDRGRAIPTRDALVWMDQALDALSYMHSRRPPVIHRDIKPSNLKLTPSGHVMLIDFGLAKGNGNSSLVGFSANYAPLEQLHGDGTDARSDLYSLGATIYRLLTAQEPQSALSRAKQIAKERRDPLLKVNAINNRVPAAVAEVVWDAMALEREDRLQSAYEMRRRLREASDAPAPNFQQAYTPTEVDQGDENNSSVHKISTIVMSIAHPPGGSSREPSIINAPVVSLPAGPDNVEASKTAGKNAAVKPALVVACLLMLLISIGAGVKYWPPARTERRMDDTEIQKAVDKKAALLIALGMAGVDFSVQEAELKQWLNDKENTSYPALAEALLKLLESKRLQKPVYLDVIVDNYESTPGVSSPRNAGDVDSDLLKAAVLKGHNARYGEEVRDFESLARWSTY